jgi:hypothetical protein
MTNYPEGRFMPGKLPATQCSTQRAETPGKSPLAEGTFARPSSIGRNPGLGSLAGVNKAFNAKIIIIITNHMNHITE